MSDQSCENRVGEALVAYLDSLRDVVVLSYHPTSAKAYQSEIIRIPKRTPEGERTRDRYHVDLIFVAGTSLWLTELKCKLSETDMDVDKLHDIMRSYLFQDLIGLIKWRLTSFPTSLLEPVTSVVPALGVEVVDDELPTGLVVFQVKNNAVTIYENDIASPIKR